jgi:hypothetical protein
MRNEKLSGTFGAIRDAAHTTMKISVGGDGTVNFPIDYQCTPFVLSPTSSSKDFPTIASLYATAATLRKMPEDQILKLFQQALMENDDLAVRLALYLRDARGGPGERRVGRILVRALSEHPNIVGIIDKLPVLGRWDDVVEIPWTTSVAKNHAFDLVDKTLNNTTFSNYEKGLCAKWMPRKGQISIELRKHMGVSPRGYRKLLVELTKVVETQMCKNEWDSINYSTIPSKAHRNYAKAFERHSEDRYQSYLNDLSTPAAIAKGVKINASAIEPHELSRSLKKAGSSAAIVQSINAQFLAMPYAVPGVKLFPMIDVSPSMQGDSSVVGLTMKDIARSIGLHLSFSQDDPFRGLCLTFSENPRMLNYSGMTPTQAFTDLERQDWGAATHLISAFDLLLKLARQNNVPQENMPDAMVVLTDMNFNEHGAKNTYRYDAICSLASTYGYEPPKVIFWNLNRNSNGKPPMVGQADQRGLVVISGFSTKILTGLKGALDGEVLISQDTILLDVLLKDRYDYA